MLKHKRGDAFPSDCSCFLTSTKFASTTTLSRYATAIPATRGDYQFVRKTVTTTIVRTKAGAPASTTSTTVTQTITIPSFVSTATTTTTTTATETTEDPCATQRPLTGPPVIRNGGTVVQGGQSDDVDPTSCCRRCATTTNCIYYERDLDNGLCRTYFTDTTAANSGTPANACLSARCYLGVQNFNNGPTIGTTTFYGGICLAQSPGGN